MAVLTLRVSEVEGWFCDVCPAMIALPTYFALQKMTLAAAGRRHARLVHDTDDGFGFVHALSEWVQSW